jgi:hypothetical protein
MSRNSRRTYSMDSNTSVDSASCIYEEEQEIIGLPPIHSAEAKPQTLFGANKKLFTRTPTAKRRLRSNLASILKPSEIPTLDDAIKIVRGSNYNKVE